MPANDTESLRLFFALWPDDDTRARLQRLQSGVQGRLTRYQNLHITLAFLGRQPVAVLPQLKTILTNLPGVELALKLDRIGYFRRNRIAWAGMHAVPQSLLDLQQSLVQALENAGIDFDRSSKFKPHVTLARDAEPPDELPFDAIDWHATQAVLVQSETLADGTHYQVLATRQLSEPA